MSEMRCDPDEIVSIEDSGYRSILRLPSVGRIVAAMLLSRTASQMWTITLVLFALLQFHSAALAGAASCLSILPGLLVSPLMGAILDRGSRTRLIILDYLVGAAALVVIVILDRTGVLTPALLLLVVALNSLTNPLSASGMRASLPALLPPAMWGRANGLDAVTGNVAGVAGPAGAGLLVGFVGVPLATLCVAGLLVCAAIILAPVRVPVQIREARPAILREARDGLLYVVANATLRGTAASMFFANLADGALVVCLPVMVLARGGTAGVVGALWAGASLASVGASLLVGRRATEERERRLYIIGIGMSGIAIAAVATGLPVLIVAGMMLMGISGAPINVGAWGMRLRRTDPAVFGRVLAISMSLNFCGVPFGSALAGLTAHWSAPGTLAAGVVLTAVGAAVAHALLPGRHPLLADQTA